MPVVKIIPSKSNVTRIEAYIKNPQKTNDSYYFGNLCNFENVTASFQAWNTCFRENRNLFRRTYYHLIISWSPKDHIPPDMCKKMASEICEKTNLKDYPYFGTIHTDQEHPHAHIVINNCSIVGKSYQSSRESTLQIKQISNEICRQYGYVHSLVNHGQKSEVCLTDSEAQLILKKNKTPWKDILRYQIDSVLDYASSKEAFIQNMNSIYRVTVSENAKGEFCFLTPDNTSSKRKPCPARRLGSKYSRENIESVFRQNQKELTQRKVAIR